MRNYLAFMKSRGRGEYYVNVTLLLAGELLLVANLTTNHPTYQPTNLHPTWWLILHFCTFSVRSIFRRRRLVRQLFAVCSSFWFETSKQIVNVVFHCLLLLLHLLRFKYCRSFYGKNTTRGRWGEVEETIKHFVANYSHSKCQFVQQQRQSRRVNSLCGNFLVEL